MKTAVVICTRNRPERLPRTLEAISRLEGASFELVIVDTSDEPQRHEIRQLVEKYNGRYIFRKHEGLAASRNTAIAQVECDVMAFLDDDCVPEKNWLAALLSDFDDASVWAVTGRIISSDPSLLFDEVASQDLGLEKRAFGPDDVAFSISEVFQNVAKIFSGQLRAKAPAPFGIGHGGNVAFRRDKLRQLGGFNEAFWRAAEDIEMFYRVLKSGGRMVYEPDGLAVHHHPHVSTEQVSRARHAYSLGVAAFFRANLNLRIAGIAAGRLAQLVVKYLQYRVSGKTALAACYREDINGFCRGLSSKPRLHESSTYK